MRSLGLSLAFGFCLSACQESPTRRLSATGCGSDLDCPVGRCIDRVCVEVPAPDAGLVDTGPPDSGVMDAGMERRYPVGCLPSDGYLFCLTGRVFEDARHVCLSAGADVIIIETVEENRCVSDRFSAWTSQPFWIGMNDDETEGVWEWVDGRSLGPFDAWDEGEPNDLDGEDCAHGNWGSPRIWNDIDCFDNYPSICEFPPGMHAFCIGDSDCTRTLRFSRCVAGSCERL